MTAQRTGAYRWLSQREELSDAADLDGLEARLRALPDRTSLVTRLDLSGTLDLTARADLERRLASLEAAMFWLQPDLEDLHVRPTLADLEKIDFDGVLREVAETLRQQAESAALGPVERRRAEEALVQLYLLTRDSRGEAA